MSKYTYKFQGKEFSTLSAMKSHYGKIPRGAVRYFDDECQDGGKVWKGASFEQYDAPAGLPYSACGWGAYIGLSWFQSDDASIAKNGKCPCE